MEPLSCKFNMALDTPADSFEGRFYVDRALPELSQLAITLKGNAVFRGIIDEQSIEIAENGLLLELSARSFAALLLDNEAIPAAYHAPTLLDLFHYHAKPYGFQGITRNIFSSFPYQVTKGTSEWEAIETFCLMAQGVSLRLTPALYLDPVHKATGQEVVFSNRLSTGIPFSLIRMGCKRYGIISQVLCKLNYVDGYTYSRTNQDVVNRGIQRRRLLNLSDIPPALYDYHINRAFQQSQMDSLEYQICLPQLYSLQLEQPVRIQEEALGEIGGLSISALTYCMDNGGWETKITAVPA